MTAKRFRPKEPPVGQVPAGLITMGTRPRKRGRPSILPGKRASPVKSSSNPQPSNAGHSEMRAEEGLSQPLHTRQSDAAPLSSSQGSQLHAGVNQWPLSANCSSTTPILPIGQTTIVDDVPPVDHHSSESNHPSVSGDAAAYQHTSPSISSSVSRDDSAPLPASVSRNPAMSQSSSMPPSSSQEVSSTPVKSHTLGSTHISPSTTTPASGYDSWAQQYFASPDIRLAGDLSSHNPPSGVPIHTHDYTKPCRTPGITVANTKMRSGRLDMSSEQGYASHERQLSDLIRFFDSLVRLMRLIDDFAYFPESRLRSEETRTVVFGVDRVARRSRSQSE